MAWRIAAALLAMVVSTAVPAASGLATLPSTQDLEPLTLLYPTQAAPAALQRGPFTVQAAVDAPPTPGNGRLVVLSHGSGGSVWEHFDLASALVAAGFTVAMPLHSGDNFRDIGGAGPVSWTRRPQEVTQTIDAVAALAVQGARLAPLRLDLQRVGVYGMSAGGLTALALAGGRWSPARLAQHCEMRIKEDFHSCVGLSTELTGGALDEARIEKAQRVIRARLGHDTSWRSWQEPRIAAVVAAVPMAAPFDMDSLVQPRVPVGLVRAAQDAWLAPRWHVDAVRASCAERCPLLTDLDQGGHGTILSPPVPGLSGKLARLLEDPPGFDRGVLPGVYARIVQFFIQHLGARP